ncbi:MAG: hypothetical protein AB7G17_06170 [Phycisphaerales bacterium]
MAIAHVCEGCGHDLSRVRASREPVYGLWGVTCPGCGKMCPRGRETDAGVARRAWRFYMALVRLEVRTAGCVVGVVAVTVSAFALAEAIRWESAPSRAGGLLIVVSHVVGGAFVHLALRHRHVLARFAALAGTAMFFAGLPVLAWGVRQGLGAIERSWDPRQALQREWLIALALAPALSLFAVVVGYPVALAVGWVGEKIQAARWKGRLTRMRARRFTA